MSEYVGALDEEQRELLPRLLDDARDGLAVPRIALRYRLQNDTHGLDRSRHRIVGESLDGSDGSEHRVVLELDHHGRADPQVIGAVLAATALPPSARSVALPRSRRGTAPPEAPRGT